MSPRHSKVDAEGQRATPAIARSDAQPVRVSLSRDHDGKMPEAARGPVQVAAVEAERPRGAGPVAAGRVDGPQDAPALELVDRVGQRQPARGRRARRRRRRGSAARGAATSIVTDWPRAAPAARSAARMIVCSSSRTLPGQS
jgi:hypothetical protein